ncbi:hypothetical protein [Yinghuangia seranimata]|uniref:hypothetical protein n=1 Tax=Yinghuangia seranimata TaxID=408067 RepID=UPI00248BEE71|nr:hypothetical protein [Yinghuangia seranimata]MDI2130714.1 hypothetical protein [Yinghuangia seranimata]
MSGGGLTDNRVQHPEYVLWQGTSFGKLLLASAIPLVLMPLDLGDIADNTGLPKGVMTGLAIPLALIPVLAFYVYKHRKLAISAQGMVLYGMTKTRSVNWSEIASVSVKLRVGNGESPSSLVLYATLRSGSVYKHGLNFIEAPALPYFARDVRDAAVRWGLPFEVKGTQAAVAAFHQLDAAGWGAPQQHQQQTNPFAGRQQGWAGSQQGQYPPPQDQFPQQPGQYGQQQYPMPQPQGGQGQQYPMPQQPGAQGQQYPMPQQHQQSQYGQQYPQHPQRPHDD